MKTFSRGGVHPPEFKELTEHKAIEKMPVPDLLYIPLSQHIGAPAKLVVNVGDTVDKGQIIGEPSGFISTYIHATVSGKVKAIEKKQNLQGRMIDHVVIENDREERWAEGLNQERDWAGKSAQDLNDMVLKAGIVGMGGATFPTHVKLMPPKEKPIDTLVINGVECEPYLTCDHRLMLERSESVASGIKIFKKILGVKKVLIGIEGNKVDAFNKMKAALASDSDITVELLEVKYPQGAEKQLIDSVLGREVPAGGLPMDVGVVVQNVATCFAVYEAVVYNRPLVERLVTVSGDGVESPANYLARIGTPMSDLIEKSRPVKKIAKVIAGGPMMGVAIFDVTLPVIKGTSGILAFHKTPNFMPGPCIRCGRCIDVCPLGGLASEMARAVEAGSHEEYAHLHVLDCMECGTCTFVCPARRPLTQFIKQAKQEMALEKQANDKKKNSEK